MTYESSRSNRTDGDRRRRRGGSVRGARRERLEHRGNRQPVRDCRRGFGELDRRPHVPEHDEHDREPYRDRVAGALAIAGPGCTVRRPGSASCSPFFYDMERKSRRRFARPILRSRGSPPSPSRKWSGTPKKRPSAMTVPYCFSNRLASFPTCTVLCGNSTLPPTGTSPWSAGKSRSASVAIFRFASRIRFARRRTKSHRPNAQDAIVWETMDPPPVV